MYLNELVAVNNHHVLSQSEHLERLLSSEGSFKTVALIISNIGDKVFKHTKFSKGTVVFISEPLRKWYN